MKVDWRPGTYPTSNVIAETPDGDPNNVIVVGAHLDSVGVGPGINDNGSGSATILEIAEQIRKVKPRNKIRFIWFGAEEHGLLGSEAYVDSLPQSERDKIAAMLNFDMVGSPNFVRFVYDGDLSDSEPPEGGAPAGVGGHRAAVPRLLREPGARDGADGVRRPVGLRAVHLRRHPGGRPVHRRRGDQDRRRRPRSTAARPGSRMTPATTSAATTSSNLDNTALDQMSDAAAHATITLAQTKRLFPSTATAVATGRAPARPAATRARGAARPLSERGQASSRGLTPAGRPERSGAGIEPTPRRATTGNRF